MDGSDCAHALLPRFAWFVLQLFPKRISLTDTIPEGNRSPIADPRMCGSITGLTLVSSSRTASTPPRILKS
jgi:hypothetical protein